MRKLDVDWEDEDIISRLPLVGSSLGVFLVLFLSLLFFFSSRWAGCTGTRLAEWICFAFWRFGEFVRRLFWGKRGRKRCSRGWLKYGLEVIGRFCVFWCLGALWSLNYSVCLFSHSTVHFPIAISKFSRQVRKVVFFDIVEVKRIKVKRRALEARLGREKRIRRKGRVG